MEAAIDETAASWAASYLARGSFPEPKLVSPRDAEIILQPTTAYKPSGVLVRFFATTKLFANIIAAAHDRRLELIAAFENHVGRFAWGSFASLMMSFAPTSLDATKRRLENVRPHLRVLETVSVIERAGVFELVGKVDPGTQPRPATAILDFYHSQTLSNWIGPNASSLEARIALTLEAMEKATPEWIRERILSLLLQLRLDPTMERAKGREKITADDIQRHLASLNPAEYDDLTGLTSSLRRPIYAMARAFR